MQDKQDLPQEFAKNLPWQLSQDSIWPAIRLTIHRNLSGFPFPPKLSDSSAATTLANISDILQKHLQNPSVLDASLLPPLQREFLYEHFLLRKNQEKYGSSRAFIVDNTGEFLALINIDDHLVIHLLIPKENWQDAWKRLLSIERELDRELSFAFSDRFGYLTQDPFLAGTGLICEAPLHLPALVQSGKINELSLDLSHKLLVTGFGPTGEFLADIVLLENKYKLSTTEDTIIDHVVQGAEKLHNEEIQLRETLKQTPSDDLKDQVSRAFGVLSHSFQLPTSEALSALSLVELGSSLGWIESDQTLSFRELFFKLRRAHLSQNSPSSTPEELLKKRAEMLHAALRGTRLKI